MANLYLVCAVAGGVLFLLQMALSLIGHDASHDLGGHDFAAGHTDGVTDHDSLFWGVLSFRAITAALTVFGIAGMASLSSGAGPRISMPVAAVCALATLFATALLLRSLTRLADDGTARVERSVGTHGTVYVSIPADRQGLGKVLLDLQNRTVELEALTYGNALPTGTRVIVTAVVGPGTVEVIATPQMGSQYVEPARTI